MSTVVHISKIIEEKLSIDRSISTSLMIGVKLIKEKDENDYIAILYFNGDIEGQF